MIIRKKDEERQPVRLQTSSGEKLGVDGMEGLLVDESGGALILEATVHLLYLHRSEPECFYH